MNSPHKVGATNYVMALIVHASLLSVLAFVPASRAAAQLNSAKATATWTLTSAWSIISCTTNFDGGNCSSISLINPFSIGCSILPGAQPDSDAATLDISEVNFVPNPFVGLAPPTLTYTASVQIVLNTSAPLGSTDATAWANSAYVSDEIYADDPLFTGATVNDSVNVTKAGVWSYTDAGVVSAGAGVAK